MFNWKRAKLRKAIVVAFQCDGCMASEHNILWIGRVEGFDQTRYAGEAARVRVMKRPPDSGDFRDRDLGTELAIVADANLQDMGGGVFFYFM